MAVIKWEGENVSGGIVIIQATAVSHFCISVGAYGCYSRGETGFLKV